MKIQNIYKIITISLVILGFLFSNVLAQNYDRFTEPLEYTFPASEDAFNTIVLDQNEFVGIRSSSYLTFPLNDIEVLQKYGSLNDSLIYNIGQADNIYSAAMSNNQTIYFAGVSSFYRTTFGGPSNKVDKMENGIYSTVINGGVSYNNKIFFFVSTTSAPVQTYLLKYDESTTTAFTDLSNFAKTQINIETSLVYAVSIDKVNGLIFIGGGNSSVVVYDIQQDKVVGSYKSSITNSTTDLPNVNAFAIDTNKTLLYSCTSDSVSANVDFFSYTPAGILTYQETIQIPGTGCQSGVVDTVGGQIFFLISTSGGSNVLGFKYNGDEQDILFNDFSFGGALLLYLEPEKLRITALFDRSFEIMNYQTICPNNCSGVGFCDYGVCQCEANYNGTGCEEKLCLEFNDCNGNGTCNNGICFCDPTHTGADCMEQQCSYNCNNRGTCNTQDWTCTCNIGFEGAACNETSPPPPCSSYSESKQCIERDDCGWCETKGYCTDGDKFGPYDGFCRTWFFDQDVEVGVIALAIIFICCIGILYLIDIGTTVPIDLRRAKDYQEEYKSGQHPKATHEEASILWWRDQRSHKAWTLMDQFQFISLVSHIGVVFPGRFISFTEYLDWSNLGIPFPPSINPPQIWSTPARNLLSMAQFENSLGSGDLYLLPNILFWFGLLCGVFLVPLLVVLLVISFIESLVHWKEVVTNRIIHISVRILSFGYIGVLLAASFAMITPLHDYRIIIPGAIIFVLYGIGLPVAIWFILNVPEARLHNPTFKQQFGCLYVHYKPKTDHRFVVFVFIKRFIMTVIVGILAFEPMAGQPLTGTDLAVPIVQVIVIDIALVGYAILLFIRKPYFDHYQLWLEYLLTAINIVTCSLSLTHIKSPSPAGELIACLIQAIALIACIASYVISWLQMRSTFLKKLQNIFSCCGSKSDKTIEMNGN